MAKRKAAFGGAGYVIRRAGTKDKTKWETRLKKTARAAVREAQWMAAHSRRGEIVCVFDLAKWGKRPLCFQKDMTKTKHPRQKHVPGLGQRGLVRRVEYRPGGVMFSPARGKAN